jgi:dihydroorotase
MPNLKPPVTTVRLAGAYRERILAARPAGSTFQPLMTLYLTDLTSPAEIAAAKASGFIPAVKYYPAGATTNSEAGVTHISKTFAALEAMEKHGLLLLVHGESTDPAVDVFDREKRFLDTTLGEIRARFPNLRLVIEHATTREAAQYVLESPANVGASITAHHLLYNRNALFAGGLRPHWYCLPVLKREEHREALVKAATSGNPKFFLGTDSAPHDQDMKEHACGSAGCFTAYAALELYAEAFEAAGALDRLEAFASFNGADFYGLPRNTGTVALKREAWTPPASYAFGAGRLVPLRAGETLRWRVV